MFVSGFTVYGKYAGRDVWITWVASGELAGDPATLLDVDHQVESEALVRVDRELYVADLKDPVLALATIEAALEDTYRVTGWPSSPAAVA